MAASRPRKTPEQNGERRPPAGVRGAHGAPRRRAYDRPPEWSDIQSARFPARVLAAVAVAVGSKIRARRRFAKLKVSGGRMALVLNIVNRR